MSHVSWQCSTLKDSVWFCVMISDSTYCIFFVSRILKDAAHSFYLVFAHSFYLVFISVFHRWTFIFNLFALDRNISTMVSCRFSERHFTLIHSHKLSNQIYLLHELSLFIFSILHPFSAEDWLLEKTFISELRKKRACQKTFSVWCNRPYIRIYWNMIQLFMLNELVNGEFHSLILSIPYRW